MVQFVFGARWRNKLTRQIIAIPYALQLPPPDWVTIRNEIIGGIKVRVYYPRRRSSNALILFIHGGGWATMRPGIFLKFVTFVSFPPNHFQVLGSNLRKF